LFKIHPGKTIIKPWFLLCFVKGERILNLSVQGQSPVIGIRPVPENMLSGIHQYTKYASTGWIKTIRQVRMVFILS